VTKLNEITRSLNAANLTSTTAAWLRTGWLRPLMNPLVNQTSPDQLRQLCGADDAMSRRC
jgi:hypothetical protein